jgi:hypothetical protein
MTSQGEVAEEFLSQPDLPLPQIAPGATGYAQVGIGEFGGQATQLPNSVGSIRRVTKKRIREQAYALDSP